MTIDEFIEEGSGRVDATAFRDARRSLNGRLWEKLESINAEEYPDLREAVQVILIADHLPQIGLADDAQLLARILERNPLELSRYWASPR